MTGRTIKKVVHLSGRGSFEQDVIRNGHLGYFQMPSKTTWTVILENATHSLRSIDKGFGLHRFETTSESETSNRPLPSKRTIIEA